MPSQNNPQYNLTGSEKIMLRAFIQGTQVKVSSEERKEGEETFWTTETLIGLQEILENSEGSNTGVTPILVQDLLCTFSDLVMAKTKSEGGDREFTKIMVKFMHYLITLIDWTFEKTPKGKPGPKPKESLANSSGLAIGSTPSVEVPNVAPQTEGLQDS